MKTIIFSAGKYFLGAAFTGNGLSVLTLPFSREAEAADDLALKMAMLKKFASPVPGSQSIKVKDIVDDAEKTRLKEDLEAYFAGEKVSFEQVRIDFAPHRMTPFQLAVLRQVKCIPYGLLKSYRQVAEAAGSPRGARAVGQAVGRNPVPIIIPCHRVINAGGGLGGFTGGLDKKKILLSIEGLHLKE